MLHGCLMILPAQHRTPNSNMMQICESMCQLCAETLVATSRCYAMWSIQQFPWVSYYHSLCRKGISPEGIFIFLCIFFFFEILNFLFLGHGFKMLVGKILSQMAPSEKVTCDILLPSRLSRSKIFSIEQRNDVEASHTACI